MFFVNYDMSNSLQKECIHFLDTCAKICMNFGIIMNKVLLIGISSLKFHFMSISLGVLKKNCEKVQKRTK